MNLFGIQALLTLICYFFFILISFWAIQGIHLERILHVSDPNQFKVLIVLLSIGLGYLNSSFFLELINNIRNLGYLLK
ncbi:DUF1146 family protein [Pediococcus ethanolidurans]|uniref:Conserved hypothetical integral membrane protein n=1 Tax=Pediococcus ethanolidurans TaxID=319653 RepID=A0A1H9S6D2_9LACO|nr:DUF1146 family protein [Pediococcus ethanolidurans]MBU7555461.1 DUF1146 family protein [Pediococcus ethanolidurans]MBU7562603.1 DUF1146 family protein [Pediococcus ethanolidurans]MCT4397973.1 DUF1146 domain-containing protein [Pediococcus ethanolidurans]MCV3314510.1 DUF1146 family protein [Pediococcus ethanolidurans]MCV3321901.1 DUF1146 family protein [Pediococcus ethanolidurans]